MSLGIGASLHDQAYMEVLIDVLDNKEGKEAFILSLKKAGLITGGVLLGTLFLGPIGMAIGGVVAGGKAKDMKGHDAAYSDMLTFLKEMEKHHKHMLVTLLENLVGNTDTDALKTFVRDQISKERVLNCVYNFLSDEFDYNAKMKRDDMEESRDFKQVAAAALT